MPHILDVVKTSEKRRFEIKDKKIRARYGHSIKVKPQSQPLSPPEILYHGATAKAARQILKNSNKPMKRQWVHLSIDVHTATTVGKRRTKNPVILQIQTQSAHEKGVKFIKEADGYLSTGIPPIFISIRG